MAEITREVYTRKLAGEAREPRLLGMWAPQPCAFFLGLRAAASGQRSTARDRPATSDASRPRASMLRSPGNRMSTQEPVRLGGGIVRK